MNILNALYTMIIGPLKLLFEFIFVFVYYVTKNSGLSIIALSFILNIILLPLYNRSDKIQEEQNEIEKKLKPGVDHIKKAFKGDERYMVLQTYYRQNNYSPLSVLKGSLSLILEIPFFIAAYDFLSNLTFLSGTSFTIIKDLSLPDQLLQIGNISINVLPILMTLINVISCIVYTKGQPLKSKIQLYLMALAFLVLLYNAPSGLAFYYLLNNIFSLVKNVVNKLNNPRIFVYMALSLVGLFGFVFIVFIHPLVNTLYEIAGIVLFILMQLPLVLSLISKKKKIEFSIKYSNSNILFYVCLLFICVFIGLYIPSTVINASPSEFVNAHDLINPISYILNSLFLSIGTFLIWINVYYQLVNKETKKIFEIACLLVLVMCIVDYMFFNTNFGFLSTALKYDKKIKYEVITMAINAVAIIVAFGVLYFINYKKKNLVKYFTTIISIAIICLSVYNLNNINRVYKLTSNNYLNSQKEKATISLSKTEKNVVVLVLDRSVNSYFPYLLEEHPELQEQFKGFTYYPNTISFGRTSKLGMNGIYGGYEYSPEEINKRDNEILSDKHDEAIQVMPKLFNDIGYDVTMFDSPDVGYGRRNDYTLFKDYDNVDVYHTLGGQFTVDGFDYVSSFTDLNRNLFCFSIMKSMPLAVQSISYDSADYFNSKYLDTHNTIVSDAFLDSYAVLTNLDNMTNTDNENGRLCILYNITTHEANTLQEPEYVPSYYVDNDDYDIEHEYRTSITGGSLKLETEEQYQHYHINMASYIQVGKWLNYLRQENVYDNTKIIIIADHGIGLKQFDSMMIDEEHDIMAYNPMLLVKDYNATEFNIDNSFMTQADVVSIACEDVIDNPINPFTGKAINQDAKKDGHLVSFSGESLLDNNGTKFLDGEWYYVKDDIFDISNWTKVEQ